LRKRKEDIPLLTSHFIRRQNKKTGKRIKGVLPSAMRILMDYNWPGNVRELENAIEHAFVLCANDQIDLFDLPVEIRQLPYQPLASKAPDPSPGGYFSNTRLSRDLLIEILRESGWNKAEAGRRVGVSRTAIWKYMKKWNIPLKGPA
jgi:two-component system response regulator HydG